MGVSSFINHISRTLHPLFTLSFRNMWGFLEQYPRFCEYEQEKSSWHSGPITKAHLEVSLPRRSCRPKRPFPWRRSLDRYSVIGADGRSGSVTHKYSGNKQPRRRMSTLRLTRLTHWFRDARAEVTLTQVQFIKAPAVDMWLRRRVRPLPLKIFHLSLPPVFYLSITRHIAVFILLFLSLCVPKGTVLRIL